MKYYINENSDYLMHHGIKGQKWGERRFQNEDGTLTPEGKARYAQYVKSFGKDTANRLMNDIRKGKTEEKALNKEYRKRKSLSIGQRDITKRSKLIGAAAGAVGGGALGYNLGHDVKYTQFIGPITNRYTKHVNHDKVDTIIGAAGGGLLGYSIGDLVSRGIIKSRKMSMINNKYTDYDVSHDGIVRFKRKMDKLINA